MILMFVFILIITVDIIFFVAEHQSGKIFSGVSYNSIDSISSEMILVRKLSV